MRTTLVAAEVVARREDLPQVQRWLCHRSDHVLEERTMKVLVLGSGPAGLMAAHAAVMENCDVMIFSHKGRKSKMMGAQYLHAPIPMMSMEGDKFTVNYELIGGDASDYRLKVYGHSWDGTVSPEDLDHTHDAWDIRAAYDRLWEIYQGYVQDWSAEHPRMIQELCEWAKPDLTISTIPAPLLCSEGHQFQSTTIWSTDRSVVELEENTVRLNAADAPAWYRAANIHGWDTVEWPGHGRKPPIKSMWEVTKPTKNNCDCFSQIMRTGRYGDWTKGVLSHQSFFDTTDILRAMGDADVV